MICKGCTKDTTLIGAHIIPKSFWVGLKDGDRPPKLMSNKADTYPKKLPIGVYDQTILCHDCEQKFQTIDEYGQKLLLKDENKQENLIKDGVIVGYRVQNFNYSLLKLFFISILWRASVSSQEFYSRISIGPFEDKAKQMVWNNSPGEAEEFSCFLAKFTDGILRQMFMDPHREKRDGVNYCRFYLFGYVLYIKVDKRPTPDFFQPFIIRANTPLHIIGRDINRSKERAVIFDIVKSNS